MIDKGKKNSVKFLGPACLCMYIRLGLFAPAANSWGRIDAIRKNCSSIHMGVPALPAKKLFLSLLRTGLIQTPNLFKEIHKLRFFLWGGENKANSLSRCDK